MTKYRTSDGNVSAVPIGSDFSYADSKCCKHCGIQLRRIPRFGGGTWLVAVSQAATICPSNPTGKHEE